MSRSRRRKRLTSRGVPRERFAITSAPASSIRIPSAFAEFSAMWNRSSHG